MPRSTTYRGYAAALGDLIRLKTIDAIQAQEVLKDAGISKADLVKANADSFDLDKIFDGQW